MGDLKPVGMALTEAEKGTHLNRNHLFPWTSFRLILKCQSEALASDLFFPWKNCDVSPTWGSQWPGASSLKSAGGLWSSSTQVATRSVAQSGATDVSGGDFSGSPQRGW